MTSHFLIISGHTLRCLHCSVANAITGCTGREKPITCTDDYHDQCYSLKYTHHVGIRSNLTVRRIGYKKGCFDGRKKCTSLCNWYTKMKNRQCEVGSRTFFAFTKTDAYPGPAFPIKKDNQRLFI